MIKLNSFSKLNFAYISWKIGNNFIWLIIFPTTHSTVFSILSISSDIHYQPKEFLKCLKICTMVKGSEVQIVTLSFVLLPLIYRLGVLQGVLGTFWLPLKEAGRNGLANQTDFPCLPDYLYPSTPVPGFADLCKTQTSGNQCFPMCYFFLLPESLLMTNPLWCLNRLSSLRWTRSVPKLMLQSVFPGLNSLLCTFPLSSYVRSCKKKKKHLKGEWELDQVWFLNETKPAHLQISWNP